MLPIHLLRLLSPPGFAPPPMTSLKIEFARNGKCQRGRKFIVQLFPPWNSHVKDGLVVHLLLLILGGGKGITNAQRFLVKLPVS